MEEGKKQEFLKKLGCEIANEEADILQESSNEAAEFSGYERIKENLIQEWENTIEKEEPVKIEDARKRKESGKKRMSKKRRLAFAACIAAVLGLSVTAYAAVKKYLIQDKISDGGVYQLDITPEDENQQPKQWRPVKITANYIPEGYVSNNADYKEKFRIYPEGEPEFGSEGLTICCDPIGNQNIEMRGICASEDAVIGKYDAKILTSFAQDGSQYKELLLFDSENGYMFTVFNTFSQLSEEEIKKIGEGLTYEVVEDADFISTSPKDESMKEVPRPIILAENFFQIGEKKQDVVASHPDLLDFDEQSKALTGVEYTVESIEVQDTLPEIDWEHGYISDTLNENVQEDGSLKPVKVSYAIVDPDTENVKVTTEEYSQKYVAVKISLHNPSDIDLTEYYFQVFINRLKEAEGGYMLDEEYLTSSEPLYLDFQDYGGKSCYRMNLAAGETRTVYALYLVSDKNLDEEYLTFNSIGFGDGSTTCWDNYIKIMQE
ncbi:MAG: hypothetical protein PHN80_12340 [Hespellia sp.]|nr:hypothetical protein [Hespellia sp.]